MRENCETVKFSHSWFEWCLAFSFHLLLFLLLEVLQKRDSLMFHTTNSISCFNFSHFPFVFPCFLQRKHSSLTYPSLTILRHPTLRQILLFHPDHCLRRPHQPQKSSMEIPRTFRNSPYGPRLDLLDSFLELNWEFSVISQLLGRWNRLEEQPW